MQIKPTVCKFEKQDIHRMYFTNGLGDQSLIPVRVISKTQKMVLDVSLPNTQHYKV